MLKIRNYGRSYAYAEAGAVEALVPEVTLTEVAYMLRQRVGKRGVLHFAQQFIYSGMQAVSLTDDDFARIAEILQTYQSADFDFVDCAVMAIAERLNITHICTYDRRDFSIMRPSHCDYFVLLPD